MQHFWFEFSMTSSFHADENWKLLLADLFLFSLLLLDPKTKILNFFAGPIYDFRADRGQGQAPTRLILRTPFSSC